MIEQILANPSLLAGIFTIVGGVALKVVEKWLSKHAETRNDRQDYRAEIKELNERIDRLEQEIGEWRTRYYREQEETALLRLYIIENGIQPPGRKP